MAGTNFEHFYQEINVTDIFLQESHNCVVTLYGKCQYEEAFAACCFMLRLFPSLPEFWFAHGNILWQQGKIENALVSYEIAHSLDDMSPLYPLYMAYCYLHTKEPSQASEALEKAEKLLATDDEYNIKEEVIAIKKEIIRGGE